MDCLGQRLDQPLGVIIARALVLFFRGGRDLCSPARLARQLDARAVLRQVAIKFLLGVELRATVERALDAERANAVLDVVLPTGIAKYVRARLAAELDAIEVLI